MSEYNFSQLNEKQLKERIRFLSDKLEAIFIKIKPQLDEFNLVKDELTAILEYADDVTVEEPTQT